MKEYLISYKEHLIHTFYVEANTENEAIEEFNRLAKKGKIDFSDGEVYDTDTYATLIK